MAVPVKVLLANIPEQMKRTLRTVVEGQDDIEVVGEEPDPVRTLIAVAETNADVVVVAALESAEEPSIVGHLLMEYPTLAVVALGQTQSCVYRFRLERSPFISMQTEILKAIRSARYSSLS
jgi:chemotaxis response regulator CheB